MKLADFPEGWHSIIGSQCIVCVERISMTDYKFKLFQGLCIPYREDMPYISNMITGPSGQIIIYQRHYNDLLQ